MRQGLSLVSYEWALFTGDSQPADHHHRQMKISSLHFSFFTWLLGRFPPRRIEAAAERK